MYRKSRLSSFYGWRIVGALAVTETISWGIIYYAFTVFITPMERELGWSRAEMTGGFSLALLIMGAMAYPVGGWVDKHGARGAPDRGLVARYQPARFLCDLGWTGDVRRRRAL
jgi:hypothetical protein